MANKDLELALRIKADLEQGRTAMEGLGKSVEDVGTQAEATSKQLGQVSESAEQQTARINAVVAASLAQKRVQDEVAASMQSQGAAARNLNANWQETVAAQNASMNAYHANERAVQQKAAAEQRAAEVAAKAAQEEGKHAAALNKLLNQIDPTRVAMAKLDKQTEELGKHFDEGRISAADYEKQLALLDRNAVGVDATSSAMENLGLGTMEARNQVGMLLRDLASGNWRGAAENALRLGNRVEGATASFARFAIPAAAVTAALAAVGFTAYQANDDIDSLNKTLAASGTLATSSAPRLNALAVAIGETTGKTSQAREVLAGLAASGKFTGDQLQLVGEAASSMAALTGKSADEVVKYFLDMQNGVAQWAAAANDEYRFLSLAQFEHIASLERRGQKEQAQALVTSLLAAEEQRRLEDTRASLGLLEGAWDNAARAAAGYWEKAKGFARIATGSGTSDDEIAALEAENSLTSLNPRRRQQNEERLTFLRDQNRQLDERNAHEQAEQNRTQASIAALSDLQEQLKAVDKEYGKVAATQELNAKFAKIWQEAAEKGTSPEILKGVSLDRKGGFSGGAYDALMKGINQQYKETEVKATAAERAAASLAKQNESWVAQLEKEAATFGQGKASRREYELDQRNLTGALQARAQAAWATLDAAEKQKQADEQAKKDTKLLQQLQLDYLKATGQNVEAAGAEIEKKYGALQKRLEAAGNADGSALVSKLMGIEQAKAELDDLEAALNRIFSEQSRREQTISTQQQAGLISELGARQQILDLNKATADQVEKLLPQMRELAAVTGDPAAIERIKDLEVRLGALRTVANEFTNALKAGFETGIQNALKGLADGTMNLQEAAESFVQSITSSMVDLAAQQLSQMATSSLMGMFGGGDQADMTSGAAAVTGSAAALSTAGASLLTGAAAIQAAATTLAAANGVSGASSVAGAATTGAASSGWFSSAASWAGSFFADGGQVRGPGTGTSDSIPAWLSNSEFVTRAAVVTQPGALGFLKDFNARGMNALNDWSHRVRHSTGGLAGVPAPALPAPGRPGSRMAEPAASMSATLKNSQTFNLIDSPERIADVLNSPAGDQAFTVMLSRDPAKFRTILGIS